MVFEVETHNLKIGLFDAAVRTKKLHNFIPMPLHCSIQWRASLIVTRIYLGSSGEQEIDHVHTTCLRGQIQRGGAASRFGINFSSFIKQHLGCFNVAVGCCQM